MYANTDGYGIWLTTENGITQTNEIYLEPSVLDSFILYVEKVTGGKWTPKKST